MAINVDIPGIGVVRVEGAASESTLQAVVAALNGSNQRQARTSTQMASDLKQAGQAAAEASSSLRDTAGSARQAKSAVVAMAENMSSSIITATGQYQVNTATVGEFAQNLLSVSTQISREWTRAFVNLASGGFDPIAASTATFKAGLDLASTAVGGVGTVMGTMFGPLGKAGIAAAGALTAVAGKAGVDFFKDQLVSSVRAMDRYNKSGAIFADGLAEMRAITGRTGLTFESFSRVVEANRDIIKGFGGTLVDGIKQLADVTESMGQPIDKSGRSLRTSLLNLGYTVEDQTALTASYLNQQRVLIGVEKTRALSSSDVAQATAKYAVDLKVLQEITGKDAKAASERAAKDTMRASLMSKLSDTQRQSLTKTFEGMNALPAEAQQNLQSSLTRYLTTGTFDPAVAMSEELRSYITTLAEGIQSGSSNMQDTTTKATEVLRSQLTQAARIPGSMASVADTVLAAGVPLSDNLQKYNTMVTGILAATNLAAGATDAARADALRLKDTIEPLQKSVTGITEASAKITNSINNIATVNLKDFAGALEGLVTSVATGAQQIEKVATGKTSMDQFFEELKTGLITSITEAWKTASTGLTSALSTLDRLLRLEPIPPVAPAVLPAAPPTAEQRPLRSRDTGTLGMTGQLFETQDFYGKVARGETVLTPKQLENLVSGVSQHSIGSRPQIDTKPVVDVQMAAASSKTDARLLDGISQSIQPLGAAVTESIKQSQDNYVSAMRDIQQEKINAEKQTKKTEPAYPEEFTAAIGKFDTVALSNSIDNLSNQVSNSAKEQQLSLTEQVTKLTELVAAMQENVRASENIANVLA